MEPQLLGLLSGQSDHEVGREPKSIAAHRLVQGLRLDPIERSEIGVEHHPLAANEVNSRLDARGDRLGRHSDVIGAPLLA